MDPAIGRYGYDDASVMWSIADIADALEAGLVERTKRLDEEQAVLGIDALDEISLHPILHHALRAAGYGIHPEERYPRDRIRRNRSEGERCDIVLTPDERILEVPEAEATLFAPPQPVALDDAFWLEVKVVAQFTDEGANARYAAELLEPVRRDVRKLAADTGIRHAGVLLVLHTIDRTVADHDLELWQDRCLERSLPIGPPSLRRIPITDRVGNSLCTLALYPVHRA
ncbi:MAG: hypothetical protein KAS72_07460 [Phycisphaerales bacterium]|nr:hypothetical protein [Phycisphaerales bacterium]